MFFAFFWISTGLTWQDRPPVDSQTYFIVFSLLHPKIWGLLFILMGVVMGLGAIWKRIEDLAYGITAVAASILGVLVALTYVPGVPGPGLTGPRVIFVYFLYALLVLIVSGWSENTVIVIKKD